MNSTRLRSGFVWLLILLAIGAILFSVRQTPSRSVKAFKDVVDDIRAGKVESVTVDGNNLTIKYKGSSTEVASYKPAEATLEDTLTKYDVPVAQWPTIDYKAPSDWSGIFQLLAYTLPAVLVVGIIYFMLRQAQGTNNQALSFGKSRARMFTGDQPTVTFDDVAGVDEAKEELREVVEFLKEPEKFISLGARIPKGVLLVGSPGTGKTLLAKAVSGEAGVPFFSISGSEFVEMFVGVGASRVRDLFDQAKRHSPCIVFVDEIDAVGRHRGAGLGGSHDEREQTLNQILVEMDGFDTDTNVIVVAATNRPDILDPALLRPGRFDRRVVLDRPDVKGREQILKVHVRGKPLAPEVDLGLVAKATPGFVGADIENLVNEAAILAARRNKKSISTSELEEAIERVIMGPERKSRLISADEKRLIAYHEAGHAIVMHVLPRCNPVHKVSIIARGMAGGYTLALPEEDNRLWTRAKFEDDLAGLLGGRAAEELVFGDITTGASNDLERATELARAMVTRYGMSEKLGPMVFGQKEELVFLGKELGEQRDYSDAVALEIDTEVRGIIHQAHRRAKGILSEYHERLDGIAKRLVEVETIDRNEFEKLFGEKHPTPFDGRPIDSRQPEPLPTAS